MNDYPQPPRPGPDFCRCPRLIVPGPHIPFDYAHPKVARPHWRGCGECESCRRRARDRRLMKPLRRRSR